MNERSRKTIETKKQMELIELKVRNKYELWGLFKLQEQK